MDIEKLMLDYLEGNLDEVSKKEFIEKINQDKDAKKLFYEWKLLWEIGESGKNEKKADTNKEWAILKNKLQPQFNKSANKVLFKNLLKYAAVLTLGIGLSLLVLKLNKIKSEVVAFNEIYVPKGQKSQIKLSDGTRIWLNADSKLTYPSCFNDNETRNVSLEGEAYFEVARNEKAPFIVNTSKIKVKVLGTSFNVKSYPGDNTVETTLIDGKVTVQNSTENDPSKELMLKQNQKAIYNKTDNTLMIEELNNNEIITTNTNKTITQHNFDDTKSVISWKEEVLIFDNETLLEISKKLERWYGYTIEIKDPELSDDKYKGKFENFESINQVLDVIGLTTPIKYNLNGRSIFIEKK